MSDIVAKLRDYSEGPTWHWAKVCDEAADEIERLRKDAERYRWLRRDVTSLAEIRDMTKMVNDLCEDYLDDAIDAAMQAKEQA